MNGESYEVRRMLKSISSATHECSEDKENCLALAQLYQSSWNTLRDHEWRLQITLWATFLIVIGVLFCGDVKALGIEVSSPKSISTSTKDLIKYGLIAITVLITAGSIGMQMAFRHFERLRDFYVKKAFNQSKIEDSEKTPLYDWGTPTTVIWIPWHLWNSVISVLSTAIVTGFLVLLTCDLLGNVADQKIGEQDQTKTIKAEIDSVSTEKEILKIKLKGGDEILVKSLQANELEKQINTDGEIHAEVAVRKGVNELRSATITTSANSTVKVDVFVLPSQ